MNTQKLRDMNLHAVADELEQLRAFKAEVESQKPVAWMPIDTAPDEIEVLRAECEKLRTKTSVTLGVGNGHGNLFVHGDYDSIKAVQDKIFELEELLARLAAIESQRPHWAKGYSTDSIAAQVSGGALSELWELMGVSNQTDAVEKLQRMAAMESQEPVASVKSINRHGDIDIVAVDDTLRVGDSLYTKPAPADKPARITEQDVREIANHIFGYVGISYLTAAFENWFGKFGGRELINKLNADREQVSDVTHAQKLWDYYQTLLKHYGFDGITDLLSKYRKLVEQVTAVAVPDDVGMIPMINGKPKVTGRMKVECIGEFSWREEAPYYDENGELHDHVATHEVPWDVCKAIYKRMASVAMLEAAPSHSQQSADTVTEGFKTIPDLPHGFTHSAYNRHTGEWVYLNHANTWQLFQGPLTDRCPSHENEQGWSRNG